jgi:hypothetical protein
MAPRSGARVWRARNSGASRARPPPSPQMTARTLRTSSDVHGIGRLLIELQRTLMEVVDGRPAVFKTFAGAVWAN